EPGPAVIADVRSVVRVDADRDVEPGKAGGQVERTLTRRAIPAGDEQALDARESRSAEDEINVRIEAVRLEMAVTVDQPHVLRRGRDGVPGPRFDPAVLRQRPEHGYHFALCVQLVRHRNHLRSLLADARVEDLRDVFGRLDGRLKARR